MLKLVNHNLGIGNGCSRAVGKDMKSLVFLQTSHAAMILLIEKNIVSVIKYKQKEGVDKILSF